MIFNVNDTKEPKYFVYTEDILKIIQDTNTPNTSESSFQKSQEDQVETGKIAENIAGFNEEASISTSSRRNPSDILSKTLILYMKVLVMNLLILLKKWRMNFYKMHPKRYM